MQEPRNNQLDSYEQMANTFAENAKAYWRLWGPLGEPMIAAIDNWAEQQRSYVRWLQQNYGNQP
jgi:hypothetical protein